MLRQKQRPYHPLFANLYPKTSPMNTFLEILKYVLPSLVVFATAWYLVRQFLEQELKKTEKESRQQNRSLLTPIRLQAYERIILLLERISLSSMIMRVSDPAMRVQDLHLTLLRTIREEFEHNLSQQIYISEKSWELVKNAKEDLIKTINTAAGSLDAGLPATELVRVIFEQTLSSDRSMVNDAILVIKREVSQLF